MAEFTIDVIETRQYEVQYTVEASNAAEALQRAANGETVGEVQGRFLGVTDRYVEG